MISQPFKASSSSRIWIISASRSLSACFENVYLPSATKRRMVSASMESHPADPPRPLDFRGSRHRKISPTDFSGVPAGVHHSPGALPCHCRAVSHLHGLKLLHLERIPYTHRIPTIPTPPGGRGRG